jgi:hypothetical protein
MVISAFTDDYSSGLTWYSNCVCGCTNIDFPHKFSVELSVAVYYLPKGLDVTIRCD